jgi:hypothetical protein
VDREGFGDWNFPAGTTTIIGQPVLQSLNSDPGACAAAGYLCLTDRLLEAFGR